MNDTLDANGVSFPFTNELYREFGKKMKSINKSFRAL